MFIFDVAVGRRANIGRVPSHDKMFAKYAAQHSAQCTHERRMLFVSLLLGVDSNAIAQHTLTHTHRCMAHVTSYENGVE